MNGVPPRAFSNSFSTTHGSALTHHHHHPTPPHRPTHCPTTTHHHAHAHTARTRATATPTRHTPNAATTSRARARLRARTHAFTCPTTPHPTTTTPTTLPFPTHYTHTHTCCHTVVLLEGVQHQAHQCHPTTCPGRVIVTLPVPFCLHTILHLASQPLWRRPYLHAACLCTACWLHCHPMPAAVEGVNGCVACPNMLPAAHGTLISCRFSMDVNRIVNRLPARIPLCSSIVSHHQ